MDFQDAISDNLYQVRRNKNPATKLAALRRKEKRMKRDIAQTSGERAFHFARVTELNEQHKTQKHNLRGLEITIDLLQKRNCIETKKTQTFKKKQREIEREKIKLEREFIEKKMSDRDLIESYLEPELNPEPEREEGEEDIIVDEEVIISSKYLLNEFNNLEPFST